MRLTPAVFDPPRRRSAPRSSGPDLEADVAGEGPADWPFWIVGLAFALAWTVISWPWLSRRYLIPWDAKAHFAPQIQFLAQSLGRGESPAWLPFAFSGSPQIADPQSMIFSPPFLLLAAVNQSPSLYAIDVTVMLGLLAGGLGVLALTRDWGWHWGGSLIAALGFAFGAAMAWRLQHFGQVLSLAYLPFAWFLLRRALLRGSAGYGAAAGLVAAFIVLGRDQVGLLCVYILAGIAMVHVLTAQEPARALLGSIKPLAAGAVVGLLIAGPPLLLTVLYAAQSNRPEIDFVGAGRGSLHPALFVTALVPHLFGATGEMERYWGPPSFTWQGTDLFIAQNMGQLYIAAPLALLLFIGLVRGALWSNGARTITIILLLSALYAVGWFTPVFRIFYDWLPGVSLYRRPADAVFLIGAFGALAAGYVAHRLLSGTLPEAAPWQRVVEVALPVAVFATAFGFAVHFDRVEAAWPPLAQAAGWTLAGAVALVAAEQLRLLRPVAAAGLLAAVATADLAVNNGPNGATAMAPSELEMLEPSSRSPTLALLKAKVGATTNETDRPRVELAGLGFHWPNASLTHRLENTLGYNPVRLSTYARATGADDTVGLPDQRRFTPLFPSYSSTLADLLGLRYIATGVPIEAIDKRLPAGALRLVAHTTDGYVYENPRALPRVLLANSARVADFEQAIVTGALPPFDARATVLLEQPASGGERQPGSARLMDYRNTRVEVAVDSPDGGWLVLHDVWHPWWRATVAGQSVPILKANVLFRAVEVPPGRQTVVFWFAPFRGAFDEIRDRLHARR